jgi:hypothetical protein
MMNSKDAFKSAVVGQQQKHNKRKVWWNGKLIDRSTCRRQGRKVWMKEFPHHYVFSIQYKIIILVGSFSIYFFSIMERKWRCEREENPHLFISFFLLSNKHTYTHNSVVEFQFNLKTIFSSMIDRRCITTSCRGLL